MLYLYLYPLKHRASAAITDFVTSVYFYPVHHASCIMHHVLSSFSQNFTSSRVTHLACTILQYYSLCNWPSLISCNVTFHLYYLCSVDAAASLGNCNTDLGELSGHERDDIVTAITLYFYFLDSRRGCGSDRSANCSVKVVRDIRSYHPERISVVCLTKGRSTQPLAVPRSSESCEYVRQQRRKK